MVSVIFDVLSLCQRRDLRDMRGRLFLLLSQPPTPCLACQVNARILLKAAAVGQDVVSMRLRRSHVFSEAIFFRDPPIAFQTSSYFNFLFPFSPIAVAMTYIVITR